MSGGASGRGTDLTVRPRPRESRRCARRWAIRARAAVDSTAAGLSSRRSARIHARLVAVQIGAATALRQVGIVRVPGRTAGIELRHLWFIERCPQSESLWKIGIRDEELAERHGVGFAGSYRLLGGLVGELLIRDIDAAE